MDTNSNLRQRAETTVRGKAALLPQDLEALSPEKTRQTLHELRLYQVELEMQNEELRRAQAELDAIRARYFDLYDLAPIGYCTLSEKGLILEANLTAAALLGVARNALVTKPLSRFIVKGDQDIFYRHRKLLFETRTSQICELRLLKSDGTFFWAHLDGNIAEVDGKPVCRVTLSDFTARKRAEDVIRSSMDKAEQERSRLSAVIDGISDEVWFSDQHGHFTLENKTALEAFRLIRGEPVEIETLAKSLEVLRPDGTPRPVTEAPPLRALAGEVVRDQEEIVRTPATGELRHRQVSSSPVKDLAGTIIGAVSIVHDITQRKKVETYREMSVGILKILNEAGELQEVIQRVITLLKTQTGFDAVGIRLQVGNDFPYFAQEGFPDTFMLTENSLHALDPDGGMCLNDDGTPKLKCTCGLVISGKTNPTHPLFTSGGSFWTNDSFPLLNLPADQDPRLYPRNQCIHLGYASIALIPIRNKDQIIGLIHLNDRRKNGFSLETVQLLEGIGAHIGAALMHKRAEDEKVQMQLQFIQAQKMESVGRLAGGIAHDFNNMLMGVLGYTELCQEALPKDHPILGYLAEITKASKRSAALTRQLLAFARQQIIAPQVLNLNETVSGMLNLLQRLIGENIQLTWAPGANLWQVKIDPSQIDQLLTNRVLSATVHASECCGLIT